MKLSKSAFNKLAKRAPKITNEVRYETGGGCVYTAGIQVSYKEMHHKLMQSSPWVAVHEGDIVKVEGVGCVFTVELRLDTPLRDRNNQRLIGENEEVFALYATIYSIVQVSASSIYGHYAVIDPPQVLTVQLIGEDTWQVRKGRV